MFLQKYRQVTGKGNNQIFDRVRTCWQNQGRTILIPPTGCNIQTTIISSFSTSLMADPDEFADVIASAAGFVKYCLPLVFCKLW